MSVGEKCLIMINLSMFDRLRSVKPSNQLRDRNARLIQTFLQKCLRSTL